MSDDKHLKIEEGGGEIKRVKVSVPTRGSSHEIQYEVKSCESCERLKAEKRQLEDQSNCNNSRQLLFDQVLKTISHVMAIRDRALDHSCNNYISAERTSYERTKHDNSGLQKENIRLKQRLVDLENKLKKVG